MRPTACAASRPGFAALAPTLRHHDKVVGRGRRNRPIDRICIHVRVGRPDRIAGAADRLDPAVTSAARDGALLGALRQGRTRSDQERSHRQCDPRHERAPICRPSCASENWGSFCKNPRGAWQASFRQIPCEQRIFQGIFEIWASNAPLADKKSPHRSDFCKIRANAFQGKKSAEQASRTSSQGKPRKTAEPPNSSQMRDSLWIGRRA